MGILLANTPNKKKQADKFQLAPLSKKILVSSDSEYLL